MSSNLAGLPGDLPPCTDIQWSRMTFSHYYCHLVFKNGNFTLLMRYSGEEWQFYLATSI